MLIATAWLLCSYTRRFSWQIRNIITTSRIIPMRCRSVHILRTSPFEVLMSYWSWLLTCYWSWLLTCYWSWLLTCHEFNRTADYHLLTRISYWSLRSSNNLSYIKNKIVVLLMNIYMKNSIWKRLCACWKREYVMKEFKQEGTTACI
jgi:hypothetical protein